MRPIQLARTRKYLQATIGNRRLVRLALEAWDLLPSGARYTLLRYWSRAGWPPAMVLMPKLLDAFGHAQWGMVREDGCVVLLSRAVLACDDATVGWILLHEGAHCLQCAKGLAPDEQQADTWAATWAGFIPASYVGRHDVQGEAALVSVRTGRAWRNYP